MIEDTVLTEYRVKPIKHDQVVQIMDGETAYAFDTINHCTCTNLAEERERLNNMIPTSCTLGFELDTECDFDPYVLKTYDADKTFNAEYHYGKHQPEGKHYPEPCRFIPGEKVWCLIHEGYNAVFPGIIVGPLTEEYLRQLYETDPEMQLGYSSADEAIERWSDWNWDSVIVRPLVRLKNDWEEMGENVIINRVYLFPYKVFEEVV